MSTTYNIQMQKYNGTDYDILYPKSNLENVTGILAIANGGTGANNANDARQNLEAAGQVEVESLINQWDEEWALGIEYMSDSVCSVNYIAIKPSTQYYVHAPAGISFIAGFYASDFSNLSQVTLTGSGILTTPDSAAYMLFRLGREYGTTYNHDISINYPASYTGYYPANYSEVKNSLGKLGNAIIKSGWNQMAKIGSDVYTHNGITFTPNGDGSVTVNGTATANAYVRITEQFTVGHKILFFGGSGNVNMWHNELPGTKTPTPIIFTVEVAGYGYLRVDAGRTVNNVTVYPQVFDLTEIFGAGNEPTIEQFKQLFPDDYYPYYSRALPEAEPLINQWDEQWEAGAYDEYGKKKTLSGYIRTTNFIPCSPNTRYYNNQPSAYSIYGRVCFYDTNKNFLSYSGSTIYVGQFTTPADAYYMTWYWEGTTYNHDISINYPATYTGYYPANYSEVKNSLGKLGNAIVNGGWNQLVKNGNFSEGTTGWAAVSGTIESTNNGLKITVDAEGKAFLRPVSFANPYIPLEQKAFVSIKFSTINLTSGNLKLAKVTSSGNSADRTIAQADFEGIEKYSVAWSTGIYISGASAGDYVVVKSINTMLLPEIFGAGNETTVEQFKQLFPDDYYPYSPIGLADSISNGTYSGIDLTSKFASEIAAAPYSGDPWAWIKARIQAGNFAGINICDYIPFTANGNTYNAQVAGINTYKNYGDTPVGNHIDFICRELWAVRRPVNPINFNNGTKFGSAAATEYPWLASDLYLFINSKSGKVVSEAVVGGGTGTDVNYTSNGIYYYLPTNLKNVIVEKRMFLPKRYSASGVLSDDNSSGWENAGKLWLPTEWEVYGGNVWSISSFDGACSAVQYPIFSNNMNRVKNMSGNQSGNRSGWWVLSVSSDITEYWCGVYSYGQPGNFTASNTGAATPVCFRIA